MRRAFAHAAMAAVLVAIPSPVLVRLHGLRNRVEQGDKQVKGGLGWAAGLRFCSGPPAARSHGFVLAGAGVARDAGTGIISIVGGVMP